MLLAVGKDRGYSRGGSGGPTYNELARSFVFSCLWLVLKFTVLSLFLILTLTPPSLSRPASHLLEGSPSDRRDDAGSLLQVLKRGLTCFQHNDAEAFKDENKEWQQEENDEREDSEQATDRQIGGKTFAIPESGSL